MLNIVCINQDNYLGRGDWYVEKLRNGIEANCTVPYKFRVLTDTGESGWWSKLTLFKPDTFKAGERILYFDLDTWIMGNIDFLANYNGPLAGLRNFYQLRNLASGILAFEAGKYTKIWDKWVQIGRPKLSGGDQMFINMMIPEGARLQDLFPNKIYSYKVHGVPKDAAVVCFHGKPRPHELQREITGDSDPIFKMLKEETAKYQDIWDRGNYRTVSPGELSAANAFTLCNMSRGNTLTDYGAGTGRALSVFNGKGIESIAVDLVNALEVEVPFYCAPLWCLPDELPITDWLYCVDVMEHLPPTKIDPALRQIEQKTVLGGYFQIAHFEDDWHGHKCHLTVKDKHWWLNKLNEFFNVVYIEDEPRFGRTGYAVIMSG